MDDRELLRTIRAQFALDWGGIHGFPHWERVRENGIRLAGGTGARLRVVELFAFLHDSRRESDGHDPGHGARAADLARYLAGRAFEIEAPDLELLVAACRDHSEGFTEGDVTVLTCWDADRLDLGRVGCRPRPDLLCTPAARGLIDWAFERSIR
ncbi:MAG: hypothetical protein L6Q95_03145 [Planctomycetes bacterium]|nr:hypothetical protein [Planctomycetota bacterium]